MKYKLKTILLFAVIILASCKGDITELDLTDNPNSLTSVDSDLLLNKIQLEFPKAFEKFQTTDGEVTRLYNMSGKFYSEAYNTATFDSRWTIAYSNIFKTIKTLKEITSQKGQEHHEAIANVLQAYMLVTLVDNFGDVPYSEISLGSDNLNPKLDNGQSVYNAAQSLLDDAIIKFNNDIDASLDPENDFYYNKDWSKWVKAANSLKMNMYLNTRLIDNNALSSFNDIVADGNYIVTNADDFQFRWGTNEALPDSRHPRYSDNYTDNGGTEYMSNSLMDYMTGYTDGAYSSPNHFDPRSFFYFYRQVSATPGTNGEDPDIIKLDCSSVPAPAHYNGYTYCGVSKGWWGRDHGDDDGIPPDNFDRALAGAYPSGGKLDDLSYEPQIKGGGNKGNGISPIMLASYTKFMIAEFKMVSLDEGGAKTALLEAMDLSWNKVYNFAPISDRFNMIFDGDVNFPLIQTYYDWFKSDIENDWDTADSDAKWNILANQYFVASYGNGINTYNFYRRTGYPTDLQPNLEPDPGSFIRSFYYPANFVNNNSSASQKGSVDIKVFWDNNPDSPSFPQSN